MMDGLSILPRPAKLTFPGAKNSGKDSEGRRRRWAVREAASPHDIFGTRQDSDHLASMERRGSGAGPGSRQTAMGREKAAPLG